MLNTKRSTDGVPRVAKAGKTPALTEGLMISVPAGKVLAGSEPGAAHRKPGAEMDNEVVEVPAFSIDALPYPNDPARAPMTNVSQEKAAQLCAAEGKRLCHELEWERACEGAEGLVYPYGDAYESERYTKLTELTSEFGVRGMGAIAEWTSGEFGGDNKGVIAVRGDGSEEGKIGRRRCAFRSKVEPDELAERLGFRCCKGPAPELSYDTPTYTPPFQRLELSHEEFQSMIRAVPELERLHDDPTMFTREDLYRFRAKAGLSGSVTKIGAITWKAIQWTPRLGEELIVATGRDGDDAFVIALYALPEKRFSHAASYTLVHERAPLILAYTRNPRHIRWLPCLDCDDGGLLHLDDEGLVSITQRW